MPSLEEAIAANTAALDRNTAMLGGKATTTTAGKTTTTAATTKITFEEIKAAIVKVKDAKGKPAAQAIIRAEGKAPEMASIKPAQYPAVMAACEAALAATDEAPADDDESL